MVNVNNNPKKRRGSAVATDKLNKSADALKMALSEAKSAHFASLFSPQCAVEANLFDGLFPSSPSTMLDEWLTNDLRQVGFLSESEDLLSSPDMSAATSPAINTAATSPMLGFDSLASGNDLMDTPLFDASSPPIDTSVLSLFPDLSPGASITVPATPSLSKLSLTIPWASDVSVTSAVSSSAASPQSTRPSLKKRMRDESQLSQTELDEIAIKRAKNTDAARRSRLKKVLKMEGLEKKVADLEAETSELKTKVAVLESEKTGLQAKETEREERIKKLEKQLQEAHQALMNKA